MINEALDLVVRRVAHTCSDYQNVSPFSLVQLMYLKVLGFVPIKMRCKVQKDADAIILNLWGITCRKFHNNQQKHLQNNYSTYKII